MFKAYELGLKEEILKADKDKVDLLKKYGTPEEELWRTDVDAIDEKQGVVFFHPEGELQSFGIFEFNNDASFEAACKQVSRYFKDENTWTEEEMKSRLELLGYDLTDDNGKYSELVLSDIAANVENYKYNEIDGYWFQ